MKRPKNTIKPVFILICLTVLILGGFFVHWEKAFAQCITGYHFDTNQNTCVSDNPLETSYYNPAGNFRTSENPNGRQVPGKSTGQQQEKTYDEMTKESSGVWYIVNYIVSKILSFMTWLVEWAIKFGVDAAQLPVVKAGWAIVLNFANLGFVLAIIVIAFATILQIQSYAMKKVLWKLIVAALLVNFSLVIAGSLLDMSNIVTVLILNKIDNGNVALSIGNALQPQKFMPPSSQDASMWNVFTTWLQGGARNVLSLLLGQVFALIFIIIFTFLAILTLLAVFIMFMVRAGYIIFLLMLSPIIWLCWIFPSTYKHWQKWWNNFIRWLLFGPASVFFLYLAILAVKGTGQIKSTTELSGQAANSNTSVGAFFKSVPFFATGVVEQIVNIFVFIVIIIGGLFVANSFGIAGGGLGISWAEKAGKGVGRWTGRKGVRAGTWATRKAGVEKFAEKLQQGDKGIYKAAKFLGGRHLGNVLRVGTAQQREKLIKQADEGHRKYSDKELALRVASMSADERTAALTRLAKNKNLNMVPNAAKYIANEKTKKIFESYGQVAAYGNLEKAFGANAMMLNAKTEEGRKEAAEEFYKKFSKDDWRKVQFNDVFSGVDSKTGKSNLGLDEEALEGIQEAIAYGVAMNNPGDVRKIILNVKPKNFTTAHSAITRVSSDIRAKGDRASIEIADQIRAALQKTLTKRLEGELFDYEMPSSPSAPPTPPAA